MAAHNCTQSNTGNPTDPTPSQGNIYFVHNNHLGTAQVITDSNQQVVWAANYEPFGAVTVTENTIDNDSRFPGQYYDAATGLYYNYFRDYDPEIGRYIQSDPIGLNGGINTYGYVGGNPISLFDPFGLAPYPGCSKWEHIAGTCPDIPPEQFPQEWIDRKKDEICSKPCDLLWQQCKALSAQAQLGVGTPSAAPCEFVKQTCEQQKEKICNPKECPEENTPPEEPAPPTTDENGCYWVVKNSFFGGNKMVKICPN